jgi:hypothetical protein
MGAIALGGEVIDEALREVLLVFDDGNQRLVHISYQQLLL